MGLVLVIGICLALLGAAMLKMGLGSRLNSHMAYSTIDAREAADAGIAEALYSMNAAFPAANWDSAPGPVTLPNSNAIYDYTIENYGENYLITSTGITDRDKRRVYAVTNLENIFDYGVIVSETITLRQGTFVDGYDSSLGGYNDSLPDGKKNMGMRVNIGTNSIEENAIQLNNNVVITGDVLVGVGGDPDLVIKELGTPGPSYNASYPMRTPYEFPDPNMPPILLTIPSLGDISDSNIVIGDPNIPTYVCYDNITVTKSADPNNPGRLDIVGEVYLCVKGDINLTQGTEIRVNGVPMDPSTWSSAKIYLYGDLNGNNSNGVNNMTEKPVNFFLYGMGSDQSWIVKNGTDFYGVYAGENADIFISAKGSIFGSVSGRNFELDVAEGGDPTNPYGMHYDKDLIERLGEDTGYKILSWWEEEVNE